jgi:hypothetical protein
MESHFLWGNFIERQYIRMNEHKALEGNLMFLHLDDTPDLEGTLLDLEHSQVKLYNGQRCCVKLPWDTKKINPRILYPFVRIIIDTFDSCKRHPNLFYNLLS